MTLKPRKIDFDTTWNKLENTGHKIITLSALDKKVWSDSYFDIYALCTAIPEPHYDALYQATKGFCEKHVKGLFEELSQVSGSELLKVYHDKWTVYHEGSEYIHLLYSYLNSQHIRKLRVTCADLTFGSLPIEQVNTEMKEIGELALETWRSLLLEPLQDKLVDLLLTAIKDDRANRLTEKESVVLGVIDSFVKVEKHKQRRPTELYEAAFESKFLSATAQYYEQEADQLLSECNISDYMQRVISRIQEEEIRSRRFLHPSTYDKVNGVCQSVMVAKHIDRLHAVTPDLVRDEKTEDLSNMYKLLKSIPNGLKKIVEKFEEHVRSNGLARVTNLTGENVPIQFVDSMLFVYNKYSAMLRDTFSGSQEFSNALDKACLHAINYRENKKFAPKASEYLSRYTDYLLRKSAKGLSEAEIEEKLNSAITIFRYIEDKDIFQKYYQRMLAQRLIQGVSVSMDAEELMINKLKQACGYEFTSKLHRMFTDIGVSKSLTERFHDFAASKNENLSDVGFHILVLQAGAWPLSHMQQTANFSLPVILQDSVRVFEDFYTTSFNGRKLTWLYSFSQADVKMNHANRPYVITMSVFQTAILLHFNEMDTVTLAHLSASTQLPVDVLSRCLQSLLDANILLCEGRADPLPEDAVFELNDSYTNRRTKFKLLMPIIQKQAEKEQEQVHSTLQQDRKYFLECIVVRIMKTRKQLKHNILMQEVIAQCQNRFAPEVNVIKKVIEQLIEKQYLQRTDNPDEYAYLA